VYTLKKITASFFLVIYLFTATAFGELLRLPLLVEHYYDHKEENSSTSLVSFLAMHYCSEDGTDKDAREDRQLPFKSLDSVITVSFISLMPPALTSTIVQPEELVNTSFGVYKPLFLSSQYLAAIWQPPRQC
jgi:hypothetical protein